MGSVRAFEVNGTVADGFEPVAEAFAAIFASGGRGGASLAVYRHGVEVVNVWGGIADLATGEPWQAHTLATLWSSTKAMAALCANILIQRGELTPDDLVASHWPEFAANGKETITVRMVLNHEAGLPVLGRAVTETELLAVDPVVEALAASPPVWTPGTQHGYHALTFGWLVGELVRRITGKSLGRFFAEEVADPLGLDAYVGLPAVHFDRMAKLWSASTATPEELAARDAAMAAVDASALAVRALTLDGALTDPEWHNDPRFWATEMPGGNGVGDARSLARMFAACLAEIDGVRLLSDTTVDRVLREESAGPDVLSAAGRRWGLGFWLPSPEGPLLGPTSFGHPGGSGSLAFADRSAGIGFGFVPNRWADVSGVLDALRSAVS